MFDRCGSSINDFCQGATIPMTKQGWKLAVQQMTNSVAFLIQAAVMTMGEDASFNMLQALNSLRCMILAGGNNFW